MAISCTAAVTVPAPSSSFRALPALAASGGGESGAAGAFLPSLSSALLVGRTGLRARRSSSRVAVVVASSSSSYGIPGYGAPRPYQTPGADTKGPRPSETTANPSFGDICSPDFLSYGAPDYSAPLNYQAPRSYSAPSAGAVTGTELGQKGSSLEDVQQAAADLGGGGVRGDDGDDDDDGGSGGGGRGDGNDGEGADGDGKKKKGGLSMSQKLTLAYAILVGAGGLIGFAKSGSSKSLMAGGGSASILYYVFLNLPTNPVMASTIGLGISTLLLFVMGSRYMESGKVFPAGVVSLFSLVMAGGYIHGIMRTSHT